MQYRDMRKEQRIDLIGEVYYEVNRSEISARWTDISKGGIFVHTMDPPSLGEQVKLRIRLGADQKSYRAVGVVRHSLKWVGMGIEFTHLHPEARNQIDNLRAVCL
jgi:c-di-GMP-binding flagellar brake protein YcgR